MELVVPSGPERAEILGRIVAPAQGRNAGRVCVSDADLREVAIVAHGFVAADLHALWREAVATAVRRDGGDARVSADDLRSALRRTRPSALREVAVEIPDTRWGDIGGKEEAKRQLRDAVEWPWRQTGGGAAMLQGRLRIAPPKGVLLFGPPGCSKTLLARAVATECRANFIAVKGAELLSKFVGDSEKAVRRTFERARLAAPCVVFFDEVDALAASRAGAAAGSAQARVVAQLLHEMDGIDAGGEHDVEAGERRVIVIAATNRPDCLDAAFVRPGRIDVQVYVGLPDAAERRAILDVHTRRVPLARDVDLDAVATDACTRGFSGAEVAALVREAAICAMEQDVVNAQVVAARDFVRARERVQPRTPPQLLAYFDRYVEALKAKRPPL